MRSHRFTASFLEQLLRGTWTINGPSSPHKLLNMFVHCFTDFTPIDGDVALLDREPEVRPPIIEGFDWSKINRSPYSVNFVVLRFS
jgi:hypothetical protein